MSALLENKAALAAIIYLFGINSAAFIVTCADKRFAVRHRRRVPERTLIALAVIGGSLGELCAMYAVRHKTQKPKFRYGVPAILAAQLIAAAVCIYIVSGGALG